MNKGILLVLFSLGLIAPALSQETIKLPGLKLLIDSLYRVDQEVQEEFINAFQRGLSMDSISMYEGLKKRAFSRHIPIIKRVVKEYGYPTIDKVGEESSSNFFPLIQHSDDDIEFQSEMLPLIKKQVDKKLVKGWEYAYLYDRIKVNKGEAQFYGTQLKYDKRNNAVPQRMRDRKNVNKRRQKLGMETLEEYLAKATEMHKKMNEKR